MICPFKNINILQLGLNLDYDTIIKQVTDGYINKKIISMGNKKLLLIKARRKEILEEKASASSN